MRNSFYLFCFFVLCIGCGHDGQIKKLILEREAKAGYRNSNVIIDSTTTDDGSYTKVYYTIKDDSGHVVKKAMALIAKTGDDVWILVR